MKKRLLPLLFCLALVLALAGCGSAINSSLPANPIAFQVTTFANPNDPSDTYTRIVYNGKVFIPFGTLGSVVSARDTDGVLGYLVRDEEVPADQSDRVIALKDYPDFLMIYHVGGVMDQPEFYRCLDTRGMTTQLPPYVRDLGYAVWAPDPVSP